MQLEGTLVGSTGSRSEDAAAKRRYESLKRLQAKVLKELGDRQRAPSKTAECPTPPRSATFLKSAVGAVIGG